MSVTAWLCFNQNLSLHNQHVINTITNPKERAIWLSFHHTKILYIQQSIIDTKADKNFHALNVKVMVFREGFKYIQDQHVSVHLSV